MTSPWKVIKRVLRLIFVLILLSIGLSITANIISKYIPIQLEVMVIFYLDKFIQFCLAHWMVLGMVLVAILSVTFAYMIYAWKKEKIDEFRRIWEVYKPLKKLTYDDLKKMENYKESYIPRKSDETIESLLKKEEHIIIVGKPKIGKTRSAYEGIKKLEDFTVIIPKPEKVEIEKGKNIPLSNKNLILLFDDLQVFFDKGVDEIIAKLKEKSNKLIVVITCRSGEEINLVKAETDILSLLRKFTKVDLEEISKEEGEKLAKDIGMQWKPNEFDGTPGSVTLDLEDMKNRYIKAKDGRVVLKAIKLLREGNLLIYKESRVEEVCKHIFGLNKARYEWDPIINSLIENSLIRKKEDNIYVCDPYLDFCVYDYGPTLKDLMSLKNMLIGEKESGSLYYLGNAFYYKKDFRHAEDCYREALKIYPKYASAHNSLGYVLTKFGEVEEAKGRYDEAERLYRDAEKEHREAIKINPSYAVDHNNLGYALSRLGEIKEINGEYREATRLFEEAAKEHGEAIRLKPHYSAAHHSLAYALGKLGRVEEAEKEYREAIRLNPESPYPHNLLGYLLANNICKYEKAEKEYREAIRLKPDYPSAHNNLGHLLAKSGKYQEAENEYRKSIDADPHYIVAYRNLASLLINLKRYDKAVYECNKALGINSTYAEAHNTLGYALVNLNRYTEAEKEYREAMRIKPYYAEAHTNLGYLLVILKKYNEAEIEYRKALEINPNGEDALHLLGLLLEKLKRNIEAEDCYKKAETINPNNIEVRTSHGYLLLSLGRQKDAEKEFEEVSRINPNDMKVHWQLLYPSSRVSDIYANRARALIKLGKFGEAENEVKEAIGSDPSNALAHKTLGILLEKRGDELPSEENKLGMYEEAEKEYRKALNVNLMHASAHRHLAILLAKLGKLEEAENEYKTSEKVAIGNYPKNHRDYGLFLLAIGRNEEAEEKLKKAMNLFEEKGNKQEAEKIRMLLESLHLCS